ncbi:hypothetical protein DFJ73DRAFT_962019 [Zopfochytrium polystomum]|nr:hypothetical protein DFJ73DRAFT_962019 [Zopfochytrium polystomum]
MILQQRQRSKSQGPKRPKFLWTAGSQWNSALQMLKTNLELSPAIDHFLNELPQSDQGMRSLRLTAAEIDLAKKIVPFLEVFASVSTTLGAEKYLTLSSAVGNNNHLYDHLKDYEEKILNKDPSVQGLEELLPAIQKCKKKLNKYYKMTDHSPLYTLATALDPQVKNALWRKWDREEPNENYLA